MQYGAREFIIKKSKSSRVNTFFFKIKFQFTPSNDNNFEICKFSNKIIIRLNVYLWRRPTELFINDPACCTYQAKRIKFLLFISHALRSDSEVRDVRRTCTLYFNVIVVFFALFLRFFLISSDYFRDYNIQFCKLEIYFTIYLINLLFISIVTRHQGKS